MIRVGAFQDGDHIFGEDELFVGRDDKDLDRRIGRRDHAFLLAGHGVPVLLPVEDDPHELESFERFLADQPAHFADAGGKHHRVDATGRCGVGADILLQAVGFDVEGELAALVAFLDPLEDITTVGGNITFDANSSFTTEVSAVVVSMSAGGGKVDFGNTVTVDRKSVV